jgi:hypothetical protein
LLKGTEIRIDPHRVPNCYAYSGGTTVAVLERGVKSWFLKKVDRAAVRKVSGGACSMAPEITVFLTDLSKFVNTYARHLSIKVSYDRAK